MKWLGHSEAVTISIALVAILVISIIADLCGASDGEYYFEGGHKTSRLYHITPQCAAEEIGVSVEELYNEEHEDEYGDTYYHDYQNLGSCIDDYDKYLSPCKNCVPTTLQYLLGLLLVVFIPLIPFAFPFISRRIITFIDDKHPLIFLICGLIYYGVIYLGLSYIVIKWDNYIVSNVFDSVWIYMFCWLPIYGMFAMLNEFLIEHIIKTK